MSLGIAPLSSYDPSLCYMQWIEGNYLWMEPASSCTAGPFPECTWNMAKSVNTDVYYIPFPSNVSLTKTYTCDNQPHDLGFPDSQAGTLPNRYVCTCGQPIASEYTKGCTKRCDRPWTASLGKRCNVVAQSQGKYVTDLITQGVCLSTAGQGVANITFDTTKGTSIDQFSTIDALGIANACDNTVFDLQNRICNCDGALPDSAWGRKIENQDPCGLQESKSDKAWIAGPVVGGVALLAILAFSFFFWQKRRNTKKQLQSQEQTILPTLNTNSTLYRRNNAGWNPSTPSETSLSSADSGVVLLDLQRAQNHQTSSSIM